MNADALNTCCFQKTDLMIILRGLCVRGQRGNSTSYKTPIFIGAGEGTWTPTWWLQILFSPIFTECYWMLSGCIYRVRWQSNPR